MSIIMAAKNEQQNHTNTLSNTEKTLHKNLGFSAIEQYKLLRTNLTFTLPADLKCAVIGVTSSIRGEGKSTTAVNLSYVLAESGKRVLLIDGDLRIPSVAKKMNIKGAPGLTNLLMGFESQRFADFKSNILDNWYIMPAGDLPPNPSELLSSHRMELVLQTLSESFDYIIVDLPPVNIVSDALAISKYIDGMVVVIREEYTEKKELEHCMRQLTLSNVKVLGCVMNESDNNKGAYGKYKKYGRYSKYNRYYYKYSDYYAKSEKND
ncbi:MAG: CpsD/CapB family tyrosine-protein kinase [Ruminococcaceae bacterium]|nr:CpsD/CapB family tyrosine-protein kinase [Oscillospiraceae bacterium]